MLVPDLEVKGTIYTILFCSEDRSQMFSHDRAVYSWKSLELDVVSVRAKIF